MSILFSYPGNETLGEGIIRASGMQHGQFLIRHFPDGESYVRIDSDVKDQEVYILCSLDQPDIKAMALMFFATAAREFGAKSVGLISPYLGYMRQDKRFNPGEAITSKTFAEFLSTYFDSLVTIDPHLHRYASLNEIYTIPTILLHANEVVAEWIRNNIETPLLIGPDEESQQWVKTIAMKADADFIVLNKTRSGDRDVVVSTPDLKPYTNHTPVLIDDIISTAKTMIKAVEVIQPQLNKLITCVGIHAVFSDQSYDELKATGVANIVTCNTIAHVSNKIDVSQLIASAI